MYEEIKPGMTVKVHERLKETGSKGEEKERIQIFEGIVLGTRNRKESGASFTVRKIGADHIGVEKIYPFASPVIAKIEIVKQAKVRRAKLYFLRDYNKRLKEKKVEATKA